MNSPTMTASPASTALAAPARRATVAVWPSIAAWSGGLILLALGAGALTAAQGAPAIRLMGVALVAAGAVAIGWGAATLILGRTLAPRIGVVGAMASAAIAVAAFALDPSRMGILAVAPAVALLLVVGVACALELRALRSRPRQDGTPGRARLAEIIIGAVLAAAVVTPALSAVEAGYLAPAGGDVVIPDTGHHH
ncbi:hypothetical protein [Microbacterium sp. NPDC056234]|uniref:hypothetical protein n=1 Tax=Microbacterium sp. NPDC056234 TaxID=3345757 RepID=UPI0035D91F07